MSKFNSAATIKTVNKEGHIAYAMTDKTKLVTQVLCSFFDEEQFYGKNTEDMTQTIKRVITSEPEFVSKLAVYARRVFNMRSVAHVLTAYLAHEPNGKPYVRKTVKGVSVRGDDITEIMAFYLATFGKPIPNALKKGINDVITGFDEYILAKYKGEGKSLKMRDLLCLCRPTPKDDEQSAMWKRCIEGKLTIPETWETQLSANGNNAETWERLIDSGKVGYMALLRNLRNIIKTNPANIDKVYEIIENPERVKKSKQLPFRFLSAYKSISDIAGSRALTALEKAINVSADNLPRLSGTTVIAVDISGSMSSPISTKSDIKCFEIGLLLGLIANKICDNSIFFVFNNQIGKYPVTSFTPILETVTRSNCGGGTNMYLPFYAMLQDNVKADRVIIISDNECNCSRYGIGETVQSIADRYRTKAYPDMWVHAIDLQGYGTQQFYGARTNIIAGWSEKVLDFITLAEQGESSLEKAINEYSW